MKFNQSRIFSALTHVLGLSASALLIYAVYTWQLLDQGVPLDDEGHYVSLTQNIVHAFTDGGFLEGLRHVFFERSHKPVSLTALGAPLLAFLDGDVNLFTMVFSVSSMATLLLAFFLIEKKILGKVMYFPGVLLCSLPFVFTFLMGFQLEAAFVPLLLLSLLFYLNSAGFTERKYSIWFGILMGISLTVRPMIGLIFWVPLIVADVFGKGLSLGPSLGDKKKVLRGGMFFFVPLLYFLPFFGFEQGVGFVDASPIRYLFGMVALLVLMGLEYRLIYTSRDFRTLFLSTRATFLVFFFWFGPSLMVLYKWAYSCSFGELAKATMIAFEGRGGLSYFLGSVSGVGLKFTLVLLSCILITCSIWNLFKKNSEKLMNGEFSIREYFTRILDETSKRQVLYLLIAAFPTLILFYLANTRDIRFIFSIFVIIYFLIFCSVFAFVSYSKRSALNLIFLIFTLIYQCQLLTFVRIEEKGSIMHGFAESLDQKIYKKQLKGAENPTRKIADELGREIRKWGEPQRASVAVLPLFPTRSYGQVMNHSSMAIIQKEKRAEFRTTYLMTINPGQATEQEQEKSLLKKLNFHADELHNQGGDLMERFDFLLNFSHVLVGPVNYGACPPEEGLGHYRNIDLGNLVVELHRKGELRKFGFRAASTISYTDYQGKRGELLLLEKLGSKDI